MSIYPKFNKNTNTFNSSNIISQEEVGNGSSVVTLDLSNFVQRNAPVFDEELYLKDGVQINMNGVKQTVAFDDTKKADLETTKKNTTAIIYDENTNKTTINDKLDLTSATIELNDDQIPQNKITGLVSKLSEIDTNFANINSNDTDIANLNTTTVTHSSQLTAIETHNGNQDVSLNEHKTEIENIKLNITEVEGDVSTNASNITTNSTDIATNLASINGLNNDVVNLQSMDTDLSANIATNFTQFSNYKTSNDASINQINLNRVTDRNDIDVNIASIGAINTLNTAQDTRLDAIETLNTTQDTRLDAIETLNTAQDVSINILETSTSNNSTNITSLQALTTSHTNSISNLNTNVASNDSDISTLQSDLLTKHNIIDNSNRLNCIFVGNGDVSNDRLSALNDVRTDVSIQNQINTLTSSIGDLDALQDIDLVNIPILQSDVVDLKAKDVIHDASLSALETSTASNTANIASNASNISTNATNITANSNSIDTINTSLTTLSNADTLHSSQISSLQTADTTLQGNIDLKNDIIDETNKLNSSLIFDTSMNDTVNNLLETLDANITTLDTNKQTKITTSNKLQSSLLNRNDNLSYVDVNSSIQSSLDTINSNISLLQGADSSIITDIQTNFDAVDISLNAQQTSITNNTNAISTLQGLQDGDVISFQNINNSITNLTNTKHPLIDTNNKLNSSLLNRDDNLQHIDITSSLTTQLATLQGNIDLKQNIINNTTNKLPISNVDISTSNLQYADYNSSINDKFISLDNQISTLSTTDVSQLSTNTSLQNQINTNISNITSLQNKDTQLDASLINIISDVASNSTNIIALQSKDTQLDASLGDIITNINLKNDIIDVNNKLAVSNVDLTGSSLSHIDITSSLQSSLDTLQTNIDNAIISGGGGDSSKIETIASHTYDDTNNTISHTYDEKTMYINPLDDNNLITLDLSLNSPVNGKNYVQNVIINCQQYKSYINTLNINGSHVTILHKGGDSSINLAPIAGYSAINQCFQILRANNEWLVTSDINLHFNSITNMTFDETAPVINLLGDQNMNIEINSSPYSEPGYTCDDNVDGDISNNVIVAGDTVDYTTLGIYNITYNVSDAKGNPAIEKIRTVNVIDTTNPVVVLIGNASIDITLGNAYTELGATASDNSNESLTVVIGGDTVDVNTAGTYVVTYTATDSTGNTHQISRSVNIINDSYVLQYSNPSQNLFDPTFVNLYANMGSDNTNTYDAVITGQASYLNGTYTLSASCHLNTSYNIRDLTQYGGEYRSLNNVNTQSQIYIDYGLQSSPMTSNRSYIMDAPYTYVGCTSQEGQLIYYSYTATNNSTTYAGEFIEFKLPYKLLISKIEIDSRDIIYTPLEIVLLGSNDDGASYNYLGTATRSSSLLTLNISPTIKYSTFKIVVTKYDSNNYVVRQLKVYGDIYL